MLHPCRVELRGLLENRLQSMGTACNMDAANEKCEEWPHHHNYLNLLKENW
jgi:hypothetical protein